MRTNEERITALHKRATELEKEKNGRRVRMIQVVSVTACFAAVVALAFAMLGFSSALVSQTAQESMRAGLFAGSGYLGYIVIGIVSFLLGGVVTVFCFRLNKWKKDKENEDVSHDRND